MVRGLFILFIIVTTFGWNEGFSSDQVTCAQSVNNNAEIFKLLSFVKNDVLGVVPKFCREDSNEQLSDKIDPGEEELRSFVDSLKVKNSEEKDFYNIDSDEFIPVIFTTMKSVILKKMWNQTKEDDQYELLFSEECGPLGLNRFPIHEAPKKLSNKKKADPKAAYQKTLSVCKSSKIGALAPFMTKDVLAETLVHLRLIFPESFSSLTTSLCKSIKYTDEAILKKDEYSDFLTAENNISSVEDFSNWLKDIYRGMNNLGGGSRREVDTVNAEMREEKARFIKQQKNYQEAYEDKKLYDGYLVEKNAKGYFVLKMNKDLKKIIEEKRDQEAEEKKTLLDKELSSTMQDKNSEDDIIRTEYFPFSIIKDENGKYQYKFDEGVRSIIEEKIEIQKKNEEVQDKSIYRSYSRQKIFKEKYENQQLLEGNEDIGVEAVEKNKRGYKELGNLKFFEKYYEMMKKEVGSDVVPHPVAKNVVLIKKDGVLRSVSVFLEPSVSPEKISKYHEGNLTYAQKNKYQKQSSDFQNILKLSDSEVAAVEGYSLGDFNKINRCLRDSSCSYDEQLSIYNISNAMLKITNKRKSSQIFFRGTRNIPSNMAQELDKNPQGYVLDKAFMSSTGEADTAKFFMKIKDNDKVAENSAFFIIKSKRCVGISAISKMQHEDEFLCPPAMQFNVRKHPGENHIYILEEVNTERYDD